MKEFRFDPLGQDYLLKVLLINVDRVRLDLGVGMLLDTLLKRGDEKIVGDFIQFVSTGIIFSTADEAPTFTEADLEAWAEFLDRMPETGDEDG